VDYIASIGDRVRRLRFYRGWSQQELARRTGLSPGHISDIENGVRKNIQARTVKKLAKGLGADIAELLDGNE
jgi:transcriptional regulator with XRE-family HTH domain